MSNIIDSKPIWANILLNRPNYLPESLIWIHRPLKFPEPVNYIEH